MKTIPKRSSLLFFCCLTLLFTGCSHRQIVKSQHEQTEITLSWWGNDTRTEYTLDAVQKFEKLHPEIKVRCNYSEWSGYEARSRVQMFSATEADVMQVNFSWLSQYSADGTGYYDIEKLSDYVDLSNFSEEMLDYGRKNGILNAIPIAMNTETVYINQTVYEKYHLPVPETWDDLFKSAEVMRKDGIYPISGADKSTWLYIIAYAEQVSGKSILDENNRLNFTPAEFQIMLELYVRMIQEKVMPQVEYFERPNLDNSTYGGTVAWVSDAKNYMEKAIENGNTVIPADYTAFSPEQSGEGWYAKPACLYAVSVNTDHPKEAATLLDFLLNSREMALLQGIEKGVPLSASARGYLEEENMLNGLQYEASLKMEGNPRLSKIHPFMENAEMLSDFISACNDVLYDKKTPEEASDILYQQAKEILK
ncbi:MAG: carbohydrate ABC transporter substrate-binding protein [Oscillospiraceae bacterium]|nr:carbohydrate ABC transporter substrate-binding protein [Oscillospiraceae bacterium]